MFELMKMKDITWVHIARPKQYNISFFDNKHFSIAVACLETFLDAVSTVEIIIKVASPFLEKHCTVQVLH